VNSAPAALEHGSAARWAAPVAGEAAVLRQYLSFELDGHVYALPLAQVAEITPFKPLNHIPHMPRSVEGLLDHRGKVIPVISLRSRMGLAAQAADQSRNIVVLDLGGSGSANLVGVLVDVVDSVLTAAPEQLVAASPLLAGPEGAWVSGFILQEDRIIALLDTALVTALHGARAQLHLAGAQDQDQALDRGLQELIALAPPKSEAKGRIIPQMEEAIAHTEQEMGKVIDCVESMLVGSDQGFQALVRLKQEAALGRIKGEEATVAEIERLGTELQEHIFELIQQLQYQDIARQKLERVLSHVRGLQVVVGAKFRDTGR
jgi:purine-binding chemotaxis protein CheW